MSMSSTSTQSQHVIHCYNVTTRVKVEDYDCCVEDRLELVNTLADGNYFKSQHPHGQLCLTAAAWAGSGQVIKLLVSYGGLLTIKNLAGNTLLHSIILQSSHYPGKHLHFH